MSSFITEVLDGSGLNPNFRYLLQYKKFYISHSYWVKLVTKTAVKQIYNHLNGLQF